MHSQTNVLLFFLNSLKTHPVINPPKIELIHKNLKNVPKGEGKNNVFDGSFGKE
jgi:hypothetical protein